VKIEKEVDEASAGVAGGGNKKAKPFVSSVAVKSGREKLDGLESYVCSIRIKELPNQRRHRGGVSRNGAAQGSYHQDDEEKDEPLGEDVETACMMCQRIVDAYGGRFEVMAPFTLRFTVPCKAMKLLDEHHGSVTSETVSASVDCGVREKMRKQAKQTLRDFLAQRAMVYVSDSTLEMLLLDSMKQLPGGEKVAVHHRVNVALTKVFDMIVVQSIAACQEVRRLGFRGKIVMMSERLRRGVLTFEYLGRRLCVSKPTKKK
jgi:hypothetical protein